MNRNLLERLGVVFLTLAAWAAKLEDYFYGLSIRLIVKAVPVPLPAAPTVPVILPPAPVEEVPTVATRRVGIPLHLLSTGADGIYQVHPDQWVQHKGQA